MLQEQQRRCVSLGFFIDSFVHALGHMNTSGSTGNWILKWFSKASNAIVANISIDATKRLDDFEARLHVNYITFFIMPY
uniref:Uncharacterized protein n=1 Tax=Aegilops tauschii subsp. strangulata TaxID=200361 RepID=A0A453BCE8_AEGTS